MVYHVLDRDPVEVIDLASRKNGRDDFLLFRRRQDENDIRRRLLQSFQKGVEGRRCQHVDLIDNEHSVLPARRGNLNLLHEVAYIFHSVVGGGVKLDYVHRCPPVEFQA